MRVLTAAQMREVEQAAERQAGLTPAALMRAAGSALAHEVATRVPSGPLVVIAGPGANGGDGWVAARILREAGRDVRVIALREPDALRDPAASEARETIAADVPWELASDAPGARALAGATGIVDALLGTGIAGAPDARLTAWIQAVSRSAAYIVSADLPSGVDADTGATPGAAVRAHATVTFIAPKVGLVLHPGADLVGEVAVADLGVPAGLVAVDGATETLTPVDYARMVPSLPRDAHKNSRGRVLVIAGSGAYPGAAVLAARGAQRAGAGYVTLAVPDSVQRVAQAHLVSVPVVGLPESRARAFASPALDRALDLARDYDAVVLGPGLTLADGAVTLVRGLVARLARPVVVDADGLNALVDSDGLLAARSAPIVLTPHPGELARLLGVSTEAVQADRVSSSKRLATGVVTVVLKGAATVTSGEGRTVVNRSGSPALATAGTGDVLAGMVGGLLARGMTSLPASVLAAHVHGRAGELAALDLTEQCVTAEEVPAYVPAAWKELAGVLSAGDDVERGVER